MADATLRLLADNQQAIAELKKFQEEAAKSLDSISKDLAKTQQSTQFLESAFKLVGGAALALGGAFAAAFAGGKVLGFLEEGTKQAIEQEDAINRLNVALAQSGQLVDGASAGFQDFAQSLSQTTKFSDDAIISAGALIEQYGHLSNESLKGATQAALDLSAAFGKDLNESAAIIGKAANGSTQALSKLGIEVQKGNTSAETFANTLKALQEKGIGGTAQAQVNTFSGALAVLNHAYEDLQKSLGEVIVKNPGVIEVMKLAAKAFGELTSIIEENQVAISGFISNAIIVLLNVIPTLIQGLDLLNGAFLNLQNGVNFVKGLGVTIGALFAKITAGSDEARSAIDDMATEDFNNLQKSNDAAQASYEERRKAIQSLTDAVQSQIDQTTEVIAAKQAEADATGQLTGNEIKLQNQLTEAIKLSAEERIKAVQQAASNPIGAFISTGPGKEGVGLTAETGAAAGAGVVAASLKGAQGALDLLAGGVSSVFDKIAPGFGAIAGEIFKALAAGPEKVRQMIDEFFKQIPIIIRNVLDSIPVVFQEFAKNIGPLIVDVLTILGEKLPAIFDAILSTFPQSLIDNFIPLLPEIAGRLADLMPIVATSLAQNLARNAVPISIAFAQALIAQAPGIAKAIIDSITSQGTGGLVGGGGGGGPVGGVLGAVGGILGFADGGTIPNDAAFQNDGAIIRASAGENIVDHSTNERLNKMLDAFEAGNLGGGGGRGPYILEVDGQQFATVMRDVKSRGFNVG